MAPLRASSRQAAVEAAALVVPLKPGAQPKAESLLAQGPPFDPAGLGLGSHEVFLTEHEAVFVFEGVPAVLLARRAENGAIWAAAETWEPVIEGSIKFADRVYCRPIKAKERSHRLGALSTLDVARVLADRGGH